MKNEALVTLVIVLVAISAVAGYLVRAQNQIAASTTRTIETTVTTTTTATATIQVVEDSCAGGATVPQRPIGNLTPVLVMQPNSSGSICVTYRTSWGGDPSAFSRVMSSPFLPNGSYHFYMYIGNDSITNAFSITPTPSSIRPAANMTRVTVVYRVTAHANSKGIYKYSAPYGYCDSMPMAVGYDVSKLKGSYFPPRPFPHSCIASLFVPVSVEVAGINVTYVDIAPSRLYLAGNSETSCSETIGGGYSGFVPCFTEDKSGAYVFDCMTTAATPSGCSVYFGNESTLYRVTVWYPDINPSFPVENCSYAVSNPTGQTPRTFYVCIPVGSTSFVVASLPEPLT